ncbi:MAG: hypothetical protein AAFY63_11830 [Cyanobacteria bacterium J06643_13]
MPITFNSKTMVSQTEVMCGIFESINAREIIDFAIFQAILLDIISE